MHRIDADANVANMFDEGDPGVPRAPTQVDADWLNAVQEEVANAIEDADGGNTTLVKGTNTQLKSVLVFKQGAQTLTGRKTLQAGATLTQSVSNTEAVLATGNGTGQGVKGTGGASDGIGVEGVGGATDGIGGKFTGTGAGKGVVGQGGAGGSGASETVGLRGIGGATNGYGVYGTGAGTGAGGFFEGVFGGNAKGVLATGTGTGQGIKATGGGSMGTGGEFVGGAGNGIGVATAGDGTGPGLLVAPGASTTKAIQVDGTSSRIDFAGASSQASTVGISNSLSALSVCKCWVTFDGNGTATADIRDGCNVASVTQDLGTNKFKVTFTTPMADANYMVIMDSQLNGFFITTGYTKLAASVEFGIQDCNGVGKDYTDTNGYRLGIVVFGRQ